MPILQNGPRICGSTSPRQHPAHTYRVSRYCSSVTFRKIQPVSAGYSILTPQEEYNITAPLCVSYK